MVTSIRLQQLAAVTEPNCWGDTANSVTRLSAAASPNTWPQTNKVTGVKWALRAVCQSRLLLLFCISSTVHCTVLYLQSWCGCRWADPWLSSSRSPAETLPDLHAPAALCQSRTGETMLGKNEGKTNNTCDLSVSSSTSSYFWWIIASHLSKLVWIFCQIHAVLVSVMQKYVLRWSAVQ